MLTRCKELWSLTDACESHEARWHGWMLTHLSNKCLAECSSCNRASNSPFKNKRVSAIQKILEKLNMHENIVNAQVFQQLFLYHDSLRIIELTQDFIDDGFSDYDELTNELLPDMIVLYKNFNDHTDYSDFF